MQFEQLMNQVTVLGAAGKMGRGIALLLVQTMSKLALARQGEPFRLTLLDSNPDALTGLAQYLREQLQKEAEKSCIALRKTYADRADLVENGEIIQQYVADAMALIQFSTELGSSRHAKLIFEAIVEEQSVKTAVFRDLDALSKSQAYFLTNTSSIPISSLDKEAKLNGRIIGCHFYNPPPVQKLVEVICPASTVAPLKEFTYELCKRLRKKPVGSNDVAGFIGNGHFLRDGLFGLQMIERLAKDMELTAAMVAVNKVTQDYLMRPMGILQLIDYVGIDVFQLIANTMHKFLNEEFKNTLLTTMIDKKVLGGQFSDGSQKPGFLKYEKGKPVGVFNPKDGQYLALIDPKIKEVDNRLGMLPKSHAPWKVLVGDKGKEAKLKTYFADLHQQSNLGSKLAIEYLTNSKAIGEKLINTKVANQPEDVNDVLTNGFYHVYGPINSYV